MSNINFATPAIIVLGSILIALGVIITALVLMQSGKSKGLSGSIAGGADTFFGKSRGSALDRILSKLTIVCSILIVGISIALVVVISSTIGAA